VDSRSGKTIRCSIPGVDKNHPWLAGKVVSEACYSTNNPAEQYSSVFPGGSQITDPFPRPLHGFRRAGNWITART